MCNGSVNPSESLKIYTTIIEAVGGDDRVKANLFPMALQGQARAASFGPVGWLRCPAWLNYGKGSLALEFFGSHTRAKVVVHVEGRDIGRRPPKGKSKQNV
uniref:Retrotransposon protein, putative, unclassified n=1 Tax=Oryza sativa subsp. japonica TaxID=39947 RepID=Q2R1X2_ORYSJ|nr:retrotransposon protein, putative, unclassified [Oryza sativa Japonica Group]